MGESLYDESESSSLDGRLETERSRFKLLRRELLDGEDRIPLASEGGKCRAGGSVVTGADAGVGGEIEEREREE